MTTIRTLSSTSDLSYASVGWFAAYAKAINGGLVAALATLTTSFTDGNITVWEGIGIVGSGLVAFTAVLASSNKFDPLNMNVEEGTVVPGSAVTVTIPAPGDVTLSDLETGTGGKHAADE